MAYHKGTPTRNSTIRTLLHQEYLMLSKIFDRADEGNVPSLGHCLVFELPHEARVGQYTRRRGRGDGGRRRSQALWGRVRPASCKNTMKQGNAKYIICYFSPISFYLESEIQQTQIGACSLSNLYNFCEMARQIKCMYETWHYDTMRYGTNMTNSISVMRMPIA